MKSPILLFLLISSSCNAAINLDGKLDEDEWLTAQSFTQMKVVQPFTLIDPMYQTEVLITSNETGIYFGFKNYQPKDSRNNDVSSRDQGIGSDKIELMLDFDNNAITAYSFQVGNGGSIRDGTFSSESGFSNEWDGNWQGASSENEEYWVAEMLIPWDVVSMKKSVDGKRILNWYVIRSLSNSNTAYSNVETTESRPRFLNDFASVSIDDYSVSSLQLFGYTTARRDFHNQNSTVDAGLDIFWKSGNGKQLTATINPDFGHIESDGLVVNFSATETFFNERRPFFTENQTLFNVNGTYGLRMIHTRRIGASPDVGEELSSGIDAAIKYSSNQDDFTYGLFAATESDGENHQGRDFYAGRFFT